MRSHEPVGPWRDTPSPTGAEDLADVPASPPDVASLGRTGDWRVTRPVMPEDVERCSRCCMCWMMCPEGAISLDEDQTPHIDYEFCKGCMICAEICPRKCIDEVRETEASGDQPPILPTP
ncbi:MAG: 4Fe-4S binding protein [Phycisphaerae bacterium]|nr:4Fe-4S binding protein [Phycisphaerae bacterium]